ncbi:pirin family protein [Kangiella geojedonensis]|uniref:Quercetin 2,3-dioxygenase n=1 Tax=Kangiella geojedonensis TaxID=914150 RepID=A0A0F6RDM1_9GAMM|nr:pirin family protein [Kangiella geojedonensis]AKE53076.1 Quercetin 2,3-dioxygenase [Kangiella geojedonensis]
MTQKKIQGIYKAPQGHWVGDGFPVRSLFSYHSKGQQISPFLLLDHAGPANFEPSSTPRGVGEHPHRGFETVTIVYQGEVSHRDSTGKGGTIFPGDVQWMTAGGGILHDEFHSQDFTERGGVMEMAQLWVNLPKEHKMVEPGYQAIKADEIPTFGLEAGELRLIAGEYNGVKGPAKTYSPLNVWDLTMRPNSQQALSIPAGWNAIVVVLKGVVSINQQGLQLNDTVIFDADNSDLIIEADAPSTLLVLSGEPLNEPVVGAGPFVMNSEEEIMQAFDDFKRGRFGESLNES